MQCKIFTCDDSPYALRDLVHSLAKKEPNYNGYYTNVPSVMLSIYNELLIKETGLRYDCWEEGRYYFDIVDQKKFMLTKIKYGI